MANRTVLIVDDETSPLLSLTEGLKDYADLFDVVTAENGRQAVAVLEASPVHLVVTDLRMPEMDGFELLAHLSRHFPDMPVIVMTVLNAPEIESLLISEHPFTLIEKPIDYDELVAAIKTGLKNRAIPVLLE